MTCNMGRTDRVIRFIVGIVIAAAGIYYQSWWGLVAIVPLGTSLVGWCPAYLPFNWSTNKAKT